MSDRCLLITGCSSGIGLDAARAMRGRGWRVFASCRKEADCARLRDEGFEAPRIDYEDESSIESGLAAVLDATGGRLDALFNNGAYACPALGLEAPGDALRAIFQANVFGWHDLTRRAIPAMRTQGHGRIVQNSSVLGLVAIGWRGAYVSTKFAIEGLTDAMRVEMRGTGIHVSLIEPGPVTTRIRENARAPFERWIDWENAHRADEYRDRLRPRLYGEYSKDRFELPPAAVTKRLIHALESPRPRARYYVTTPTYLMGTLRRILPTRALDWVISKG